MIKHKIKNKKNVKKSYQIIRLTFVKNVIKKRIGKLNVLFVIKKDYKLVLKKML